MRCPDDPGYIIYALFFHELFYSFQNVKRGAGIGESGGAYLNGTGASHKELYSVAGGSYTATADNGYVHSTGYIIYHCQRVN